MRGLTIEERAELQEHMESRWVVYDSGSAAMDSFRERLASLVAQGRLMIKRMEMDRDRVIRADTKITDLGKLALRVCP